MGVKIVKYGTLFLNSKPVAPGSFFTGERMSIGNTCSGKELEWVIVGSILVATRNICLHISWADLNAAGFVYGTLICIDNRPYLCRCMTGSEWDAILDTLGDDNKLWHWTEGYSWFQEEYKNNHSRLVRGYFSARRQDPVGFHARSGTVGFRPVLEPLVRIPDDPAKLVGKHIRGYDMHWNAVKGKVVAFDDYDLILQTNKSLPEFCGKIAIPDTDDRFVVPRDSISWMRGKLQLPAR